MLLISDLEVTYRALVICDMYQRMLARTEQRPLANGMSAVTKQLHRR